jgi:hypothetical protein
MACANSPTCLRAKLHPSRHKGGSAIGVESKSIKVENVPTIEDKDVVYACICKMCFIWSSSQSPKRNRKKHTLVSLCPINPSWRGKKNTIEETIKISATPPHQMGHMLGDQGESKKQSTPPVEKQKGCVCIGMAKGAQMEVAKRI